MMICHSLTELGGDPLDVEMVDYAKGFNIKSTPQIIKINEFESKLQRMSVVT